MNIIQSPSPNYGTNSLKKDLIVLHKTLGIFPTDLGWMRNPTSNVSAHYYINRVGEIHQLVKTDNVAWHSGVVNNPSELAKTILRKNIWGYYINPNRYSIGIELSCKLNKQPTTKQLNAVFALLRELNITKILTHRDITSYKPNLDTFRSSVLKKLNIDSGIDYELLKRLEGKYVMRVKSLGQIYKIENGNVIFLDSKKGKDNHVPLYDEWIREFDKQNRIVGINETDFRKLQ